MTNQESILEDFRGEVMVGNGKRWDTCQVVETKYGLRIISPNGMRRSPMSSFFGYSGRRGSATQQIVCDDSVSAETEQQLRDEGFSNVSRRG